MKSTLDVSEKELRELRKTDEPGTLLTKNAALVLEGVDRFTGGNLFISASDAKKVGVDVSTYEGSVTGKSEDALLEGAGVSQEVVAEAGDETTKLIATYLAPKKGDVIKDVVVPTTDGQSVTVHLHYPADAESLIKEKGVLPVVIAAHGGNYTMGEFSYYTRFTSKVANGADAVVAFVDYRLAPEWKYPSQTMDILATWNWLQENSIEYSLDRDRIALFGDSAGANLIAGVVLRLLQSQQKLPVALVLMCPNVSLDPTMLSSRILFSGLTGRTFMIPFSMFKSLQDSYLEHPEDCTNPLVSPLVGLLGLMDVGEGVQTYYSDNALDLELPLNHPPTLIQVAQVDPLRDEGKLYYSALKHFGTDVSFRQYDGMFHEFFLLDMLLPEATQALDDMNQFLKQRFN